MDSRFTDLKNVLTFQGLEEREVHHGNDLVDEASASRCEAYTTLLRGALADRGHLLNSPKMAKDRGLVSGAKLVTQLLADHRGGALTTADVNRGLLAITRKDLTCAELLGIYLQCRRYIGKQQAAA